MGNGPGWGEEGESFSEAEPTEDKTSTHANHMEVESSSHAGPVEGESSIRRLTWMMTSGTMVQVLPNGHCHGRDYHPRWSCSNHEISHHMDVDGTVKDVDGTCGLHREDGSGLQPLNDLFVLNTEGEMRWEYPGVDPEVPGPSPRNAGTLTALEGGRLVFFGGWDPFRLSYNDTYLLDVSGYADISPTAPLVQDGDDF